MADAIIQSETLSLGDTQVTIRNPACRHPYIKPLE
jgi:hypothetical protein